MVVAEVGIIINHQQRIPGLLDPVVIDFVEVVAVQHNPGTGMGGQQVSGGIPIAGIGIGERQDMYFKPFIPQCLEQALIIAGGDENGLVSSILPRLRQCQAAHQVPRAYLNAGISADD